MGWGHKREAVCVRICQVPVLRSPSPTDMSRVPTVLRSKCSCATVDSSYSSESRIGFMKLSRFAMGPFSADEGVGIVMRA